MLDNFAPREADRLAVRTAALLGGGGISCNDLECGDWGSSCVGASVEEGQVDEELKRRDDELSYKPAVKPDRSVPPLPLGTVSGSGAQPRSEVRPYRFWGSSFSDPAKIFSRSSDGESDGSVTFRDKRLPSLTDLLSPWGRSMTRNDVCGGVSTSSRTLPADFRRAKPLGNLIGIVRIPVGPEPVAVASYRSASSPQPDSFPAATLVPLRKRGGRRRN